MQMHHQKIAMLPDSRVKGIMQSQATAPRIAERSTHNPSSDGNGRSVTETAFCVFLSIFSAISLLGLALLLHAHLTGPTAPYRITQAIDVTPARAQCLSIDRWSPQWCYSPARKMDYDLADTPWRRGLVRLRPDYHICDHQDFLGAKDKHFAAGWLTNSLDESFGQFKSLPKDLDNDYIGVYSKKTLDKILQDPGVLSVQDMPFDECYGVYLPNPWRDLTGDQTPIPDLLYHVLPKDSEGMGKSMISTRPTEARPEHLRGDGTFNIETRNQRRDDYTLPHPSYWPYPTYEDSRSDWFIIMQKGHTLHQHLDHLGVQIVGHAGPHKWKACDPKNATRCGYLHRYEIINNGHPEYVYNGYPQYDAVFDEDMVRRAALDPGVVRIENWNYAADFGNEPPECRDLEGIGLDLQHLADYCPPREKATSLTPTLPDFNASSPTLHDYGAFFHEKNYTLAQHLDFLNLTLTSNETSYPNHTKACDRTDSTRCGYFKSQSFGQNDEEGYWAHITDEMGALASSDPGMKVIEKVGPWNEKQQRREFGRTWPEDYGKVEEHYVSVGDDEVGWKDQLLWMTRHLLPSDHDFEGGPV